MVWLAKTLAEGVIEYWEAVEDGAVARESLRSDAALPMSSLAVRMGLSGRSLATVPLSKTISILDLPLMPLHQADIAMVLVRNK